MRAWRVYMEGVEVEWEFRDAPDYYTRDGKRRDGEEAKKIVRPAVGIVELQAEDEDHARAIATRANPEYHKIVKVEAIG